MNLKILDNYIYLYDSVNFFNAKQNIEDIFKCSTDKNIWQISYDKNINETDCTKNKKIFYLNQNDPTSMLDNINNYDKEFIAKKEKMKFNLNNYAFPFINNYIKDIDISIKKIKDWTIISQQEETNFHDDMNRNNDKHHYTVVIALNNDYDGGEIHFKNRIGNEYIKLMAGNVLIYPSNSQYQHRELAVINGNKYTAVTYF